MNILRKSALAAFLLVSAAFAQTPITGTFTVGSAPVANGTVAFSLKNCGAAPTAGSASYSATLNSSGVISTSVQGNTGNGCVLVSGTNLSYYQITVTDSTSHLVWRRNFQIPVQSGSWNLATATPLAAIPASVANSGAYVPTSGGVMTGPLVLPGDPTTSLQAATKQYVDSKASASCLATPAPVQVAPFGTGTLASPSTATTTFSSNTAAGNLIYARVTGTNFVPTLAIGDSQGNMWTLVTAQTSYDNTTNIYVAANIAGGQDTITATTSGLSNTASVQAIEYSGVAHTLPVDGASTSFFAPGGSGSLAALTTTQAGDLIITTVNNATAASILTGYTQRASNNGFIIFDELAPSSGALSGSLVSFTTFGRPASGGGFVVPPYGTDVGTVALFAAPVCGTGSTGATGPAGPAGLIWLGAWSSVTAYVVPDAVSYNGSSYVALLPGTNQNPATATTYWGLLAQQGAAGSTGATGATGATGPSGGGGTGPATVITPSATPVFDATSTSGFKITLTGSPDVTSSTFTNGAANQTRISFEIVQDSSGSHPFVWPSNVHNPGFVSPAASSHSVQTFAVDPSDGSLYPTGAMQYN